VRVQVRVVGPAVEMVERRGDEVIHIDLCDGSVVRRGSRPRRRGLTLQESDDLGHRFMVRVHNPRLCRFVRHAPEDAADFGTENVKSYPATARRRVIAS
jgi:hypothetical protein